jgi:hypothetical protein
VPERPAGLVLRGVVHDRDPGRGDGVTRRGQLCRAARHRAGQRHHPGHRHPDAAGAGVQHGGGGQQPGQAQEVAEVGRGRAGHQGDRHRHLDGGAALRCEPQGSSAVGEGLEGDEAGEQDEQRQRGDDRCPGDPAQQHAERAEEQDAGRPDRQLVRVGMARGRRTYREDRHAGDDQPGPDHGQRKQGEQVREGTHMLRQDEHLAEAGGAVALCPQHGEVSDDQRGAAEQHHHAYRAVVVEVLQYRVVGAADEEPGGHPASGQQKGGDDGHRVPEHPHHLHPGQGQGGPARRRWVDLPGAGGFGEHRGHAARSARLTASINVR